MMLVAQCCNVVATTMIMLIFLTTLRSVLCNEVLNVELVTVGSRGTANTASLIFLGPAMSVAIEQVNARYDSLNFSLTYVFDDMPWLNLWSNDVTVRMASQWYYRQHNPQRLSVLIIPAGNIVPDLVYVLRQWNILFNTVVSMSSAISDRIANPSWISTARLNYPAMAMLFCEVLVKYNWTTVMTVLDLGSGEIYKPYLERIVEYSLVTIGRTPLQRAINASRDYDFIPLLTDIRSHTRVVIFLGYGEPLRNFLIAAHQENMTNGNYVYMAFEVLNNTKFYGLLDWEYHDEKDAIARLAFQSLLIMRPADIYDVPQRNLADSIISRTKRDFGFSYSASDQPFQVMLSAYGAVTALAEVLNDLLKTGNEYPWLDGSFLAKQFYNRTFNDNATEMTFNDKGARQADLYIWRFNEKGEQKKFLYKNSAKNARVSQMYEIKTWANGTWPPLNEPVCGFGSDRLACYIDGRNKVVVPASISAVAVLCVVTALAGLWCIRRTNRKYLETWWKIGEEDLMILSKTTSAAVSFCSARKSVVSGHTVPYLSERFHLGKLNGLDIVCEVIETVADLHSLDKNMESSGEILLIMDKLRTISHPNISRFYGIVLRYDAKEANAGVVMERPGRGCIYDVFDGLIALDMTLISSLMTDFLEGVQFIHSSPLVYHGCLCGVHCHVDKHFTLKISGLVNARLHRLGGELHHTAGCFTCCTSQAASSAEEHQKKDICAVGVVLWELLNRRCLSSGDGELLHRRQFSSDKNLNSSEHRHSVHQNDETDASHAEEGNIFPAELIEDIHEILQPCWQADLHRRPSVKLLRKQLCDKSAVLAQNQAGTKLFDKVQKRLREYTRELESEVEMRTKNLVDEVARCNEIVAQFLPRWVASQISSGKSVPSELFDCATILFTQVCGLSTLIHENQPKTAIDLIAELEGIVDRTIAGFYDEIYKVEAVDDSFLFASGLPVRNGDRHAEVIAELATKLLESEPGFFRKLDLQLKSGIHTGPCAAGIVGFRRLRYCLFGDTVNTASRMCSYGLPNRIQMTAITASMISETSNAFVMEYRGNILIKGKDTMETYWLNGYTKE